MAVILAAFGEGAFIRRVGGRVEHPRVLAVACHALALEVGDVLGQRRRAEARALVAHDARFHHHAAGVRSQPDRDRRAPAASEARPAAALARAEAVADMARPSSRPASPRRQRSVGACRHGCRAGCAQAGRAGRRRASSWCRAPMRVRATALEALKCLHNLRKAPAAGVGGVGEFLNLPNHMRRAEGRPFPLPSVGWSPPLPCAHTQTCPIARQTPMRPKAAHSLGSRADRGANSPSDCGARPVQSAAGLAIGSTFATSSG